MINDETIIPRLIINEGMRLKPYKCTSGKTTIGVGRNLDDNPLTDEEKALIGHDVMEGITEHQATMLLINDIKKVKDQLDKNLPWWRDLDNERQFVMIDLCFNMGISGLLTFHNTLRQIATGWYIRAGDNLLKSKYAKQVGKRAERNAECIKTGVYKFN